MNVERLQPSDKPDIVDVLCEAFYDYPVMRFVVGPTDEYADGLHALNSYFVAARTLRNDPMFGIRDGDRLIAVATSSNPALDPHPDWKAVGDATWAKLGIDAQQRYALCDHAWQSTGLDVPQFHVNMLGVRDAYRGKGYARLLLDEVHAMCEESSSAHGVSLTTEQPRNVEMYQHLGYEVVGEARVSEDLNVWNLFRRRQS